MKMFFISASEKENFIRYDMFKDGHKLDEFTDKIIERSMMLQI